MNSASDYPLLRRLLEEGELSVQVKQSLVQALNDPGIDEWRASGNTLQIDVYKADGRVELFDLLEGPDAPAQAISIEDLKAAC
ncbi:hypothetical protein [Caulobacter segnis]